MDKKDIEYLEKNNNLTMLAKLVKLSYKYHNYDALKEYCTKNPFEVNKEFFIPSDYLDQKNPFANQIYYKETSLHIAITNYDGSSTKTIKTLLECGANVNIKYDLGYTLLHCVVIKNLIKIAKLLLDNGGNVNLENKNGMSPLYRAIIFNRDDIIFLFLAYDAYYKNSFLGKEQCLILVNKIALLNTKN